MKIVPGVDDLTRPYWEAAADHRLIMQCCTACGKFTDYPPIPICPHCNSTSLGWRSVSGRGTVDSFTIVHHPVHPVVVDGLPYTLVVVALDEGPRMLTQLRECPPERVHVGLKVEVVFEDLAPDIGLPQFRPVS